MKILVTGSKGQLGNSLSDTFDSLGIECFSFPRTELDIRDSKNVNAVVRKVKPNYIINTAAFTDVDRAESEAVECESVNSLGPRVLAEASLEHGCTLVQISTDYVFDGKKGAPYHEHDVRNPINTYGKSKALGESNIEEVLKDNYYILRTSWLYSKYGKNFAKTMAKKALESKETVRVVADQFGQPTFAGDLSSQIHKMLDESPAFGIYNATNSGVATWFDFAQCIFEELGEDKNRVLPISSSEFERAASRPQYSALADGKWIQSGLEPLPEWRKSVVENIHLIAESLQSLDNR
jgi:dTDP-4-dehydrorhamnose reductase